MTGLSIESYDRLEAIGRRRWNDLWSRSEVPSVFARFEWASAWWQVFGDKSSLRIFAASEGEKLAGLLPTIWTKGQDHFRIGLVGEEHADYAALLTDPETPEVFRKLLDALLESMPPGSQIELADVRSDTSYFGHLESLTRKSWSKWTSGEEMLCPRALLSDDTAAALANKSSLRRKARKLAALGNVGVEHYDFTEDIVPQLPDFFQQHIDRWAATDYPSLFLNEANRAFYSELTRQLAGTGHLVFTSVMVDNNPVAYHFGFVSEGEFIWYKPTYNKEYAKVSPGEVLIRELLLMAGDSEASGFDFTRGDEAFKLRFADDYRSVRTFVCHPSRTSAAVEKYTSAARKFARQRLPTRLVTVLRELRSGRPTRSERR